MAGIQRLPNPFIASAASSPADRPAASSRLNCGDAAEFAAPTGEPERGRFVLDEVAFMSAIDPRAAPEIPSFLRRAPSAHAAIKPKAQEPVITIGTENVAGTKQ